MQTKERVNGANQDLESIPTSSSRRESSVGPPTNKCGPGNILAWDPLPTANPYGGRQANKCTSAKGGAPTWYNTGRSNWKKCAAKRMTRRAQLCGMFQFIKSTCVSQGLFLKINTATFCCLLLRGCAAPNVSSADLRESNSKAITTSEAYSLIHEHS